MDSSSAGDELLAQFMKPHPLSNLGVGIPRLFKRLSQAADAAYRRLTKQLRSERSNAGNRKDAAAVEGLRALVAEVQTHCGLLHALELTAAEIFDPNDTRPALAEYNIEQIRPYMVMMLTLGNEGFDPSPTTSVERRAEDDLRSAQGVAKMTEQLVTQRPALMTLLATDSPSAFLRCLTSHGDLSFDTVGPQLIHGADIAILRKLGSCVDPSPIINERYTARAPGTWREMLGDDALDRWYAGDLHRLWLHGGAGVGKSVLAATVLTNLHNARGQDEAVLAHFADFLHDPRSTDPELLHRNLLVQLCAQNEAVTKLVRQQLGLDALDNGVYLVGSRGSTFYMDLFYRAIGLVKMTHVIFDGIDEGSNSFIDGVCNMTNTVFSGYCNGDAVEGRVVKVLMISRYEDRIRGWNSRLKCEERAIMPSLEDIQALLKSTVEVREGQKWTDIGDEIAETVHAKCASFDYAKHQIHELYLLPSDLARREALQDLPKNLTETFERQLRRTSRDKRDTAILDMVLKFSQFAAPHPLRLEALCEAVSAAVMPAGHTTLTPVSEAEVQSVLGGLAPRLGPFEFDKSHPDATVIPADRRLIEHLLDVTANDGAFARRLALATRDAELHLAKACLRMVLIPEFGQPLGASEEVRRTMEERKQRRPFYRIAARSWVRLVYPRRDRPISFNNDNSGSSKTLVGRFDAPMTELPNVRDDEEIKALQQRLFQPEKRAVFDSWLFQYLTFSWHLDMQHAWHYPIKHLTDLITDDQFTPLHSAAALAIPDLCRYLITAGGYNPNGPCKAGTPLRFALLGGHAFDVNQGRDILGVIGDHRFDVPETVKVLMELGATAKDCDIARGSNALSPSWTASIAALALTASVGLRNADIFMNVVTEIEMLTSTFHAELRNLDNNRNADRHRDLGPVDVPPDPPMAFMEPVFARLLNWTVFREEERYQEIHDTVWKLAEQSSCACADFKTTKRPIPDVTDEMYRDQLVKNLNSNRIELHKHMMQDPRWDANITLEDDDDDENGQTILHRGAEQLDGEILELLFEFGGADHAVKDAKGRTPLHLVETERDLRIFAKYGADFGAKDNYGRSIWHVAAANNDVDLLKELMVVDGEGTDSRLKSVSNYGRTPLGEAFQYIRELLDRSRRFAHDARQPHAALLFLQAGCIPKGKEAAEYLACDVPLLHLAAEWGIVEMVDALIGLADGDVGVLTEMVTQTIVDDETEVPRKTVIRDISPLHCLNFNAGPEVVEALQKALKIIDESRSAEEEPIALINRDGKTPVETLFLNAKFDQADMANAHPSHWRKLDVVALDLLLTEEVRKSVDKDGKGLWERFCDGLILPYCTRMHQWEMASVSLVPGVQALVDAGVVKLYEAQKEESGLGVLARAIWNNAELVPPWLMKMYLAVLKDTEHFEKIKDDESIVLSLQWAVGSDIAERDDLIEALLSRDVSMHAVARGLSTLDALCHPACGKCDVKTFTELVSKLKAEDINQLRTFGLTALQLLCTEPDNMNGPHGPRVISHRLEKFKALIKAGADPNLKTADGTTTAILATLRQQPELAKYLILETKVDVNAKADDGLDVALAAASRGFSSILLAIKNTYADFDFTTTYSMTIAGREQESKKRGVTGMYRCNGLHIASLNGHASAMDFYLRHKLLDPNGATHLNGLRPLHFAAMSGIPACIELLVQHGADANVVSAEGWTPLHKAVHNRHPDAVKALLKAGCPPLRVDNDGMSPFMDAVRLNAPLCADALLKASVEALGKRPPVVVIVELDGEKPDPGSGSESPSISSGSETSAGHPDAAREGPKESEKEEPTVIAPAVKSRRTNRLLAEALEQALKSDDENMVQSLITRHNCPVDSIMPSCRGCTALMSVVWHGRVGMTKLLLDLGASVFVGACNRHYRSGYNTITEGVGHGGAPPFKVKRHTDCLGHMLDAALRHGLNWFAAGETPVHAAAERYNPGALVRILEHVEANVEEYSKWLLVRHDADKPLPPLTPLAKDNLHQIFRRIVNWCTESGPSIQPVYNHDAPYFVSPLNPVGTTALHFTASAGNHFNSPKVMKKLLEYGANPNALDEVGQTPLLVAVNTGSLAVAKILLEEAKANPDIPDYEGVTPLVRAAGNGNLEMIKLLIKHGADVRFDQSQSTNVLLQVAQRSSEPAVFGYFVREHGLDPWARDGVGDSNPLHEALRDSDFTSYLLNGDWDIWRLAHEPDIQYGLLTLIVVDEQPGAWILPRLLKRFPAEMRSKWIDMRPSPSRETGMSPLCEAAKRGMNRAVRVLLRFGADVEFEGSEIGTAVIVAARFGRLNVIKILVRAGASLDYFDAGGKRRSAMAEGARWRAVRDWILVGRWRVRRLGTAPHKNAGDGTVVRDKDMETQAEQEVKPWSGITKAKYRMTGSKREHPRMPDESGLAFATRLAVIERSLAGRSIVPYDEPADGQRPLTLFGRAAMANRLGKERNTPKAP